MKPYEYLLCIKKLNPQAHCVICRDTPDGELYPKWDPAHIGVKPTIKDCEAVLAEVQAEIQQKEAEKAKEQMIRAEMDRIVRVQAVDNLIVDGTLVTEDRDKLLGVIVVQEKEWT